MNSKLVRNKVVLGKTSLDVLAELNRHANKVGCEVIIGMLPVGGIIPGRYAPSVPTACYRVVDTNSVVDFRGAPVGFNKEEVLALLLDRAQTRG